MNKFRFFLKWLAPSTLLFDQCLKIYFFWMAPKPNFFLQTVVTHHFYRLWHTSSASDTASHNFHKQLHKTPNKECVNVCMCPCSWVSLHSIWVLVTCPELCGILKWIFKKAYGKVGFWFLRKIQVIEHRFVEFPVFCLKI